MFRIDSQMAEGNNKEEYVAAEDYVRRAGHYGGERNEDGERHGQGKVKYGN